MKIKGLFLSLCFISSVGATEITDVVNEVTNIVEVTTPPLDFSPQALYLQAHPIVQSVIWILLLCSIMTWTILLFKSYQFFINKRKIRKDIFRLNQYHHFSEMLQATEQHTGLAKNLLQIASQEQQLSLPTDPDLTARIEFRLTQQVKFMTQHLRYGIGTLATIGSVTPFIGLFGTVWGIMNSFIGIAQNQSADLFAVAPGIAEALFATALGLIAAIPAVVIYNFFVKQCQAYSEQLQRIAALILLAVRREQHSA